MILKKGKGSDKLRSGFLILGNEFNEGIGNNVWFSGFFMKKRQLENECKMEEREWKENGMQQFLTWIFMENQRLGKRKSMKNQPAVHDLTNRLHAPTSFRIEFVS